jgi:hypothetical protein
MIIMYRTKMKYYRFNLINNLNIKTQSMKNFEDLLRWGKKRNDDTTCLYLPSFMVEIALCVVVSSSLWFVVTVDEHVVTGSTIEKVSLISQQQKLLWLFRLQITFARILPDDTMVPIVHNSEYIEQTFSSSK